MVPKYPAARARINRNGSDSSGSEISCDTGNGICLLLEAGGRDLSVSGSRERGSSC